VSSWKGVREIEAGDIMEGFRVPPVEVSFEPHCTLDILRWPPIILLTIISLPTY